MNLYFVTKRKMFLSKRAKWTRQLKSVLHVNFCFCNHIYLSQPEIKVKQCQQFIKARYLHSVGIILWQYCARDYLEKQLITLLVSDTHPFPIKVSEQNNIYRVFLLSDRA